MKYFLIGWGYLEHSILAIIILGVVILLICAFVNGKDFKW